MRQRTCSHRISELYNEIILSGKFKEKYITQESFYLNNIYFTIFKDNGFKAKLLIIDKESQNIIFENLCDNSFLTYKKIDGDLFLYSIDIEYSIIHKFNNPILNNGIIKDSINVKHPFIALSKSINDIIIKDELLYFSVNINGIRVEEDKIISIEVTKEKNYLTAIDNITDGFVFQEIAAIIGINACDLKEIGRDIFNEYYKPIKCLDKNLNRKNSLLIEVYDGYFMEDLTYFIDYSKGITKQLHPPYLVKSNSKYLLILPYYDYNSYPDFKLIRLSDLSEIDLYKILPDEVIKHFNELDFQEFFFGTLHHQFLNNDLLFIGDYEFSCDNLFKLTSKNKKNLENKEIKLKTLIPIKNNDISGFALDIHTIKSTLLDDGKFETTRTDLGELLFRLKYKFDRSTIEEIAVKCSKVIQSAYSDIDVIIPAPPSNLERPFQPVFEVAKRIGELTKIPIDLNYVVKLPTEQIKSLNNQEDRNIVLDRSISIIDNRYKNKNVLIFDDLYRSGDTLSAISKRLLNQGKVNTVKVLCITKTRTKSGLSNNDLNTKNSVDVNTSNQIDYSEHNISKENIYSRVCKFPENVQELQIEGKVDKYDQTIGFLDDISFIENLKTLKNVYLSHNHIKDISPLKTLSKIEILDIGDNLIQDINSISKLTRIKELHLYHNNLSNVNDLAGLINLEVLSLAHNHIEDIKTLSNLPKLKWLSLCGNTISDISPLLSIPSLEIVTLSHTSVSENDIKKLSEKGIETRWYWYEFFR